MDDVVWASRERGRGAARGALAAAAIAAVVGSTLLATPAVAANSDIGYPTFSGSPNPVPARASSTSPAGQLQSIFDADAAAGAGSSTENDFWFDEMLARTGTAGSFGDDNQWLFTRGRAAFMKEHTPGALGFGGQLAYWESIDGRIGYTITAQVGGADVPSPRTPPSASRPRATGAACTATPARASRSCRRSSSPTRTCSSRTSSSARPAPALDVTLRAISPYATLAEGVELTGTVDALNDLTVLHPRSRATASLRPMAARGIRRRSRRRQRHHEGAARPRDRRDRGLPHRVRRGGASTPAAAYTSHVTAYNRWWADNVPYLDTPEDNIDKTLFYRWWLMRFNFLDADMPGNTYQFPTSMEGVLGYNNSIVLTTGMFIDDLKYFRDPIYSYGPWVSAGETSKSYKYVDNPGDPANWSNSYTQYISEAAWRSYQLHGGPTAIAENLASTPRTTSRDSSTRTTSTTTASSSTTGAR